MATWGAIKPNHKAIKSYYEAIKSYARQDVGHESALRSAFQNLLDETGRRMGWTLTCESDPHGVAGPAVRSHL